jgi:hypothetical protein
LLFHDQYSSTTEKSGPWLSRVSIPHLDYIPSCKWTTSQTPRTPRDAKKYGPSVVPDFHHTSFVRFGLYQKHWHGLRQIPIPGQGCLGMYFSSYYSRMRHRPVPLFHLFRVVPIATLPIPFDQSLLYGHLISLFTALYTGSWLSSTSSQAAQITKRVCSYTFA